MSDKKSGDYHFMEVHAKDENGVTVNSMFFDGRLPKPGEAVEMVYTGQTPNGGMLFQLRVKE